MNIMNIFKNITIFGSLSNHLEKVTKFFKGEITDAGPYVLLAISAALALGLIICGFAYSYNSRKKNLDATEILKKTLIGLFLGSVCSILGWGLWLHIS
ncbi:hypothetical protein [Mycoplasma capricolum]|uniref:hypothetical protein n=1 Tax=Mycoplasma capricolum TaxID=2095 RepID=UPI003DA654CD